MREWQHPLFLLLLFLLPLLAAWSWRRRPRYRFASLGLVRPRPGLRRWFASLPAILRWVALGALVVALARPQLTRRETVVRSEGIDIMLVLDTSGSMESPDFTVGGRSASRLDVAKAVIHRFVEGRPHDRIGLVVFGEEAFTQVPLTLDHTGLATFLAQVDIGMAGRRATAVGDALAVAARRMAELEAPSRVVILLTDGRSNAGSLTPEQAAAAAAALDIRVHTIGVGPTPGMARFGLLGRPTGGDLDEATLRQIAQITGARYFRAEDTETLQAVYDTIDALEKSTAEVREYVHREERFHPWAGWALALLTLEILLSSTLLRRLP